VPGREVVLARVRAALAGAPRAGDVPRGYGTRGTRPPGELVERFVKRVREYRAVVVVTDDPAAEIGAALAAHGARRVGVAADLPESLRPREAVVDMQLGAAALDALDGAVTSCAAACSDTGTIALDGGPGQGRRALTLLPDLHVCVVRAEQIVETVPELLERLEPVAREGRPIVLVSGPSATSDIELERVEGVHGPRRLVVVVAT